MMHYIPLAWPFFFVFLLLFGIMFALLEIGILKYAYESMGVNRRYMLLLLVGSLRSCLLNTYTRRGL